MPKKPADEKPTRLEQAFRDAGELDARRREQISNQKYSINRLLKDGSYSEEMASLHETLAETQVLLAQAQERLKETERSWV